MTYCCLLRTQSFWSGRQSENDDPVQEGQRASWPDKMAERNCAHACVRKNTMETKVIKERICRWSADVSTKSSGDFTENAYNY